MAPTNYDGINAYSGPNTAGSHGDIINDQSNASDLWTIIAAGTGDTVNVGSPTHTMAAILGDLRIQCTRPTVNRDDSAASTSRSIDLATDSQPTYPVAVPFHQCSCS